MPSTRNRDPVLCDCSKSSSVGAGGAQTYGHSLIIDPWGGIIAEADESTEGIIYGTLDKTFLEDIRKKFPVKSHQRHILR